MSQREAFVDAILSRTGCPYIYGRDGPNGFDCSGLVVWGLKQIKCCMHNHAQDATSRQLAEMFGNFEVTREDSPAGALWFYGNTRSTIDHVMIVARRWDNGTKVLIGARGGDSKTNNIDDAKQRKAYVDTVWENYWSGRWQLAVDPFMNEV